MEKAGLPLCQRLVHGPVELLRRRKCAGPVGQNTTSMNVMIVMEPAGARTPQCRTRKVQGLGPSGPIDDRSQQVANLVVRHVGQGRTLVLVRTQRSPDRRPAIALGDLGETFARSSLVTMASRASLMPSFIGRGHVTGPRPSWKPPYSRTCGRLCERADRDGTTLSRTEIRCVQSTLLRRVTTRVIASGGGGGHPPGCGTTAGGVGVGGYVGL